MEYAALSSVNSPSAEGVGFYRSLKSRVADNGKEKKRDARAIVSRLCIIHFYFKLRKYNGAQRRMFTHFPT